jgi:hypothetical protein
VIALRRKLVGESVKKTVVDFKSQCVDIRRRCLRWATDNDEQLRTIRVVVPTSGNDRADDNWEPVFKIAAVIGGCCPGAISAAMMELVPEVDDTAAFGIKLLADIREIFTTLTDGRVQSARLVELLKSIEDSPWADLRHGKGLTQNGLSKLLRPFGINSKKLRFGPGPNDSLMGYELGMFKDAFARYLNSQPPFSDISSGTPEQNKENSNLSQKTSGTGVYSVPEQAGTFGPDDAGNEDVPLCSGTEKERVPLQNDDNPLNLKDCSGVPLQNPKNGPRENIYDPGQENWTFETNKQPIH